MSCGVTGASGRNSKANDQYCSLCPHLRMAAIKQSMFIVAVRGILDKSNLAQSSALLLPTAVQSGLSRKHKALKMLLPPRFCSSFLRGQKALSSAASSLGRKK